MASRDHQFDEAEALLAAADWHGEGLHVWNPIWKVTGAASPTSAHCTVMT